MKKLLVICGPTATGKTNLALKLADTFNGKLISADSRQVYRGMDIGTGKDIETTGRILGYDLVEPTQEFSVAQYLEFANAALKKIWSSGKLPIIVGGTGLYIRALISGIETANVPRNKLLRSSLEKKSVAELFDILASDDPVRAAGMNTSDRKNPRRLIRAIEVAIGNIQSKRSKFKTGGIRADILMIGLTAPKEIINYRISDRVDKRIDQGIEREIDNLLKRGVNWDMQSMQSLGYRQFQKYFQEGESINNVVESWRRGEEKYAKRQLTWFKKDKHIKWFDVSGPNYLKQVEESVKNWYTGPNAQEN